MKRFGMHKKGVSPVIATIIIVAVAIVMSIAVAYWALGLGASLTRYEKLQFTSAYATGTEASGYKINVSVKNTGSAAATLDKAFANGVPIPSADVAINPETLQPGDEANGTIDLDGTAGSTVEIMLQTAAGNQYPKVIVLP